MNRLARHSACLAVLVLAGTALCQPSGLVVSYDNAAVDLVEKAWNGSAWQIYIWANDARPDTTVTITATQNDHPIDYIKLECDKGNGGTLQSHLLLDVAESGSGTISRIGTIEKQHAFSTAEVWVHDIEISGYIGDQSSPHSAKIDADIVAEVRAADGIYADVTSGPREFGGTSTISVLQSSGGPIRGDISALYGVTCPHGLVHRQS